jgi:hypothetical protein
MSRLGELLEVLHGAHERMQTLRAELRDWMAPAASSELLVDFDDATPRLHWRGAGPWPRAQVGRRLLWWQRPERLRVELLEGGRLVRVAVRDGGGWWWWDCQAGVSEGIASDSAPPSLLDPPLLAPQRLIGPLRLEAAGDGECAGRRVLRARAWPRHSRLAADVRLELEFDAEHGTMLRRAVFEKERLAKLTEAVSISYDVPIERSRFEFSCEPGACQAR